MDTSEWVSFQACDGFVLKGRVFRPSGEVVCGVLLGPATGVRQVLYFAFAEALAERGCLCLTMDFRGVGESRGGSLRGSGILKQHWGERDLPAGLEELCRLAPGVPAVLVGHSAGGQLVGLMPNVSKLSRVVLVAASSGYIWRFPWRTVVQSMVLFYMYAPISHIFFGYTATKKVGLGEDLPKGVLQQWRAWCSSPGYIGSDLGVEIPEHFYDEVRCPILHVRCTDDPIATPENVDDFMRFLPNASVERMEFDPEEHGVKALGHIDWFRSKNKALWGPVLDWVVGV